MGAAMRRTAWMLCDALALFHRYCNFVRIRKTPKCAQPMAAGAAPSPWGLDDIVAPIDARAEARKRPRVHKPGGSNPGHCPPGGRTGAVPPPFPTGPLAGNPVAAARLNGPRPRPT